jgi:hypothetical protein
MTVLRFPDRVVDPLLVEPEDISLSVGYATGDPPEPEAGSGGPDLGARIGRGDLRHATLARCAGCLYQFYAPAIGCCPKCKSTDMEHILSQELDYTRC